MSDLENCRIQLQNALEQNIQFRNLLQEANTAIQKLELEKKSMMYWILNLENDQDYYDDQRNYDGREQMEKIVNAFGESFDWMEFQSLQMEKRLAQELGLQPRSNLK